MKNKKTPMIDGFAAEFDKVFWGKLVDVFNGSYKHDELPISLTHGLISCLPNGQMPREFIKNWRPITLLSVLYKLALPATAN